MNDPEVEKIVKQDLADAETLNVRKTPGFFVNGKPLTTFGYKQLQDLVDSEINANYEFQFYPIVARIYQPAYRRSGFLSSTGYFAFTHSFQPPPRI